MSASIAKDSEVHVTYEDQQQINQFARTNARMQDMKDELEQKKKDIENLDDAENELLMLDDDAEDFLVPNMIGEVFVNCTKDITLERLARRKAELESEIAQIDKSCNDCKDVLSALKVKLYAKFGTNINLENEED